MTQALKIGLLLCHEVDADLQSQHGSYGDIFRRSFSPVDVDLLLVDIACYSGEIPDHPDDYDGYIISGSQHSVYETLDWIEQLSGFLQHCQRLRKKCVGICFGHQLIAHSLGGTTRKASNGWGIGVQPVTFSRDPSWSGAPIDTCNLLFIHQDQVVTLPENFITLAANDRCLHCVITDNDAFLGIQGHPEFDKCFFESRLHARTGELPDTSIQQGFTSLSEDIHHHRMLELISQFFRKQPAQLPSPAC